MGRPTKPKTPLAQRLVETRGDRSRVDFSESVEIKVHNYTAYERGISAPSVEAMNLLARHEGINLHWLLTGDGDMYLPDQLTAKPLDASLMELVVEAVDEFGQKNHRFKFDQENRWRVYMSCYQKLLDAQSKHTGPDARSVLKQELFDLLTLATL